MKYLVLAPLTWFLIGCGGEVPKARQAASSENPVIVTTVTAVSESWPQLYEASGTLRARTTASISARLIGIVREVKVQVGDRVREGQLLVILDSRDLEVASKRAEAGRQSVKSAMPEADSGVALAKANLDLAQTTFGRMQDLFQKKSISNQEFDEVSARLKSAQATYEMMRARRAQLDARLAEVDQEVSAASVNRSYANVLAPFPGVVTARTVEPGSLASPGTPLLTLEREGTYRLEVAVEEGKLASIRAGQPVVVTLDSASQQIEARVSEVVPAVDAASRTYVVKIDLPPLAALRSGIFGRAAFHLGSRTVLTIPAAALSDRGQLQTVMAAVNAVARARLVTTGERRQDRVEVLSGLSAGEAVILPVPRDLGDGMRIEVRP